MVVIDPTKTEGTTVSITRSQKKTVRCPECGYEWKVGVTETKLKCPKCNREFWVFYLGGLRG